jgi:hypothetical protein
VGHDTAKNGCGGGHDRDSNDVRNFDSNYTDSNYTDNNSVYSDADSGTRFEQSTGFFLAAVHPHHVTCLTFFNCLTPG